MIFSRKQGARSIAVSILVFCAVFVCTLFLNYRLDLIAIEDSVSLSLRPLYDALITTSDVVVAVTGGCLIATTAVLLIFYVLQTVDRRKREIGLLRALGYSGGRIALGFASFGISVGIGAILGFAAAYALMPTFYVEQNSDGAFDISPCFHPSLLILLVILPTLALSGLAVIAALQKLSSPPTALLFGREKIRTPRRGRRGAVRQRSPRRETSYLRELRQTTLKSRKMTVFLMAFSAFCFSAMIQMAASMDSLSSALMAAMVLLIGLVLAFTTLLLSASNLLRQSEKPIAMMSLLGYTPAECRFAILSGYRTVAWLGFLIGTLYQYILLRAVVGLVFSELDNIPEYHFDLPVFILTAILFALVYEGSIALFAARLKRVPVGCIMME